MNKANTFPMKEILERLPEIGLKIFNELDNKSLSECRIVTKSWTTCIDGEKFIWVRKLQCCVKYRQEVYYFSSELFLNNIVKNSNLMAIKQMVNEAQNGYLEDTMSVLYIQDDSKGTTPLHRAAEIGHLTISALMMYQLKDKCPRTKVGSTPLHTAAFHGHIEVYRLMSEFWREKNPKDLDLGRTPLHWAARNGHLDICELIIDNTVDKNPKAKNGVTPLHLAARQGHSEICDLILEKISI